LLPITVMLACVMLLLPPPSTPFPYPTLFRSGVHRRPTDRHVLRHASSQYRAAARSIPHAVRRGALRASAPHGSWRSERGQRAREDRKSTRLNSSHVKISYAVFCLKKKILESK